MACVLLSQIYYKHNGFEKLTYTFGLFSLKKSAVLLCIIICEEKKRIFEIYSNKT